MPSASLKSKPAKTAKKIAGKLPARTALKPGVKTTPKAKTKGASRHQMDTLVKEGDFITFAPSGEQLRVAKIERGAITFEKIS